MALKPGDILETAFWLDGRETEEMKRRFSEDFGEYLARVADEDGVYIGPMKIYELKPGEERVPPVPDDLQGPDVRLIVAEATVAGLVPQSEGCFVADLEPKDLERLRTILRRVHRAWNPGKPELSNEKCDEYINRNGPKAALAALREQVGTKVN